VRDGLPDEKTPRKKSFLADAMKLTLMLVQVLSSFIRRVTTPVAGDEPVPATTIKSTPF
jgi:hypothetical protein